MAIRIPSKVWSALGPIPVNKRSRLIREKSALGRFHGSRRIIELDKEMPASSLASTLLHEMTHVALWDSGVQNSLTHEQLESVCDALGAYFGGMMLAGCLTLRSPKET